MFSFSLLAFLQCAVWNTFGPIVKSVEYAYDWSDATVAMMANWGTIMFIIFVFPLCWLLETLGLRVATITIGKRNFNVTWHIISDQRVSDFFFAFVKMPKICKLQDAQKCRPRAEFGI